MKKWIEDYLNEQSRVALTLARDHTAEIQAWLELLRAARERGAQVFACGNGGSAANSSHFAVDLGKGASGIVPGKTAVAPVKRFRVLSLTDNVPWLTALANDCLFDDVFVEQLKNYGNHGDILIAISVSGNSPNVIKAVEWANSAGLVTLGLVGNRKDNRLSRLAKRIIAMDSDHYGRVEDAHMHVLHILCYAFIEEAA